MEHDIFISFSFADQKTAEEIVNQLQSKYGISCWICTHDIKAGAHYKRAIVEAITEAKACVLIQSVKSMESEEIPKEISVALTRKKTVIPFVLDDSVLNPELEYDLSSVQRIDARKPTLEDRIGELAAEIRKVIGYSRTHNESVIEDTSELQLVSTKISCNSGFMGRDDELQTLHDNLELHDRVFLYGIGGIGKSEIAKQYAKRYSGEYDEIIFATYTSTLKEMVTSDTDIVISNFGKAAGETEDEYFTRKLSQMKALATEKTLIIVDNFDTDYDDSLEEFADGKYRILFTTRNDHSDTGYPVIPINELDSEEQYELFIKIYNRPIRGDDEEKIREILRHINGHTLTIELIAKMTQAKRQPAKILEAMLNSGISSVLTGTVKRGFKNDEAYMYIHRLFSMSKLSDEEQKILMNMSLMPIDGVDFVEFADWCGIEDYEVLDNLIKRSWIIYDAEEDKIRLHPLICEVVYRELSVSVLKCQVMFEGLISKLDNYKYRRLSFEKIEYYGDILESIFKRTSKIPSRLTKSFDVIVNLLSHLGRNDSAMTIAKENLDVKLSTYSENSHEVAISYYDIADCYGNKGDRNNFFVYLKKSIDVLGKVAPNSLDYAFVTKYYVISKLRRDQLGDADSVYSLLCQCAMIFQSSTEDNSILVNNRYSFKASLDYTYALYYYRIGEYDKAIVYATQSCDEFRTSKSAEDNPWVMSPLSVLAFVYSIKGDKDEALKYAFEGIEIACKYYHPTHHRVHREYEYLAEVYHNLKMYDKELEAWQHIILSMDSKHEVGTLSYARIVEKMSECKKFCVEN